MSIRVIRSGLLTMVQDLGRFGFQKDGVTVGGAMDQFAHRIANILVRNEESEGTLEMTFIGPTLAFEEDALVAICGGEFEASIDGQEVPLWRPVFVKQGSILTIGHCRAGCRAYLAVSGGFHIPKIMNSQSTYLLARIGGFQGRALQKDDVLLLRESRRNFELLRLHKKKTSLPFITMSWGISFQFRAYFYKSPKTIRVIQGAQFAHFTTQSQKRFFTQPYKVTSQSNRMGYRLEGPLLQRKHSVEMVSGAVTFGTIQVPNEGKPIILMADRQTTGGYPKIAQVIAVDLPILAQTKPGEQIVFHDISFEEAQRLYIQHELSMKQCEKVMMSKMGG
ncbi:Allophanate hydrolase subunit 2 [Anoxybacillus ayderensis]|uniref:Allophanate hydrolase subunit 2 n=1 Tax=Anoxybacillus ayderensis TaxID=265546 RepID=A0A0D0HTS7_9BACL|nr:MULTISPECIES: biotin-dependent carboxyltransferase family protein [Anoxybacillus]KIP22642.1 Allophanate hydrolase subunit 2 [Anoxybacillus ayderensis]